MQIHREFRKPLVMMSPKGLLRHSPTTFAELAPGSAFQPMIPDSGAGLLPAAQVTRVVFCSGKLYWQLLEERQKLNKKVRLCVLCGICALTAHLTYCSVLYCVVGWLGQNIALSRVEQLAPFPFHAVAAEIARFPNAEVVWCQEEPMNMGAWTFVQPRFETATKGKIRAVRPSRPPLCRFHLIGCVWW